MASDLMLSVVTAAVIDRPLNSHGVRYMVALLLNGITRSTHGRLPVDDSACLTLARWSVSHGPLPTVSRVKDGENFPLLQQLKRGWPDGASQVGTGKDSALQLVLRMEYSGGASGRCR